MWHKKKHLLTVIALIFISLGALAIANSITGSDKILKESVNQDSTSDNEVTTDEDPWKEIERLVENYYSNGGVLFKGKMKLVDESQDMEKILEESDFEYTLLDEDYCYRVGTMEVINNNGLLLAIDQSTKTIAISRANHKQANREFFSLEQFKQILEEKKAAAKVSILDKEKIITVDNIQDPAVQGYRIFYNPDTYKISKIEIGMVRFSALSDEEQIEGENIDREAVSENGKSDDGEGKIYTYFLEVSYAEIRNLSLNKNEFHPENKFIQTKGKTVALTPAYQSFTLVNAGE